MSEPTHTPEQLAAQVKIARMMEKIVAASVDICRGIDEDASLMPHALFAAAVFTTMKLSLPGHERRALVSARDHVAKLFEEAISGWDRLQLEQAQKGSA